MILSYINQFDNTAYTLSESSEDSLAPASNVRDIRLSRRWRTTGITSEWIKIDAGTGVTITPAIAIIAQHNLTASATIKIQASTNDFSTTSLDVTIAYNADNMVKTISDVTGYRYWRFSFADTTNTDGYIEIGRLFLGSYYTVGGVRHNLDETRLDTTKSQVSQTGQYYADQGYIYKSYMFDIPYMTSTQKGYLQSIFNICKRWYPLFMILDDTTSQTVVPCLYCVFDSDLELNHIFQNQWTCRVKFREVK